MARVLAPSLRTLDRRRAQDIGNIAVNSAFVLERVRHAWDRDGIVIYPPVAVDELLAHQDWRTEVSDEAERRLLDQLPDQFILGASRMVDYKRLDVVINAGDASGLPVVIAGSGPCNDTLREYAAAASVPVTFAGRVSDAMLRALMQQALVYVFPPVEDFGIMPVEAMTLGTPVVVNSIGGARESVEMIGLGVVSPSFCPADLAASVRQAASISSDATRTGRVSAFSESRFREEIVRWVGG